MVEMAGQGGDHKYGIMIGYLIFLGMWFFLQTSINFITINGNYLISGNPVCSAGICQTGVMTWIDAFFSLFNFNTAIGIINVVILAPFFSYCILLGIEYLEGLIP
jgi:hypothetical protein